MKIGPLALKLGTLGFFDESRPVDLKALTEKNIFVSLTFKKLLNTQIQGQRVNFKFSSKAMCRFFHVGPYTLRVHLEIKKSCAVIKKPIWPKFQMCECFRSELVLKNKEEEYVAKKHLGSRTFRSRNVLK